MNTQAKHVFFTVSHGHDVGLTSMTMGLVRALERDGIKVGFLKPVAQAEVEELSQDLSSHTARTLCNLEVPTPISFARAQDMFRAGEMSTLLEEVVALAQQAQAGRDVLIVEGLTSESDPQFVTRLNAEIARTLSARQILVMSGADAEPAQIAEAVQLIESQQEGSSKLSGVLLNMSEESLDAEAFAQALKAAECKTPLIGSVPFEARLDAPRMKDIADALSCEVVAEGKIRESRVMDTVVAARSVEKMAERLLPGVLIVTPGDRSDIILATALAVSRGVPVAGLLLTCDQDMAEEIMPLLEPATQAGLTILSTEEDTFTTSSLLAAMRRDVTVEDMARMQDMIDFSADHMNLDRIKAEIGEVHELRMPPAAFRHRLVEAARQANCRIVLPEGDEPRTLQAAVICHEKKIARCVLVGEPARIQQVAAAQGLTLPADIEIIDPKVAAADYIGPMVELRKSKGLTPDQAEAQLEDSVVLGTMMLAMDDVDGLVSGAVHTTASTVRPALQLIKTAPGASIVSSVFFMLMPDQVFVYGDCAINPDPSAEQLADIAIQSADSALAFGIKPRVAMISYSTGNSGTGSDVEKVREATRIAQEKRPDLLIDGPMQYDAASVESVGRQKAPNSKVAGQANVFVFPDLNTGNTTYKAVQRSANLVSVGPMLQGLKKPVNDLSRGALVDDIVYTIALTAIQAMNQK